MSDTPVVPDLVSEHESSKADAQIVPDLVGVYEARQSRNSAVPDLVGLHEASQPPFTYPPAFLNSSGQFRTMADKRSDAQPHPEAQRRIAAGQSPRLGFAEEPRPPIARVLAPPGSFPKPAGTSAQVAAGNPRAAANQLQRGEGVGNQGGGKASSTLAGPGPNLTLAAQKKPASQYPAIASRPENQPAPDPDYVANRATWQVLAATDPSIAPAFEFDPEQERLIEQQEKAEAAEAARREQVQKLERWRQLSQVSNLYGGTMADEMEEVDRAKQAYADMQKNFGDVGAEVGKRFVNPSQHAALMIPSAHPIQRYRRVQQEQPQFEERHPVLTGIGAGVGRTVFQTAGDPMTYALMAAGPAGRLGKTVMGLALGAKMAYGAYESADQLEQIWDRPDITQEQKVEAATQAIAMALMAGMAFRHGMEARFAPTDPLLAKIPLQDRQAVADSVNRRIQDPQIAEQIRKASGEEPAAPVESGGGMKSREPYAGQSVAEQVRGNNRLPATSNPLADASRVPTESMPVAQPAAIPAPERTPLAPQLIQPEPRESIASTQSGSGRQIEQPPNSETQPEALASDAASRLADELSRITATIPGTKLHRVRPQEAPAEYSPAAANETLPGSENSRSARREQVLAGEAPATNRPENALPGKAPPGALEEQPSTGRPSKGGLSISAPDYGLEKYSIGEAVSVPGKPKEFSYPILDQSNRVAGYARIAMRRGNTAEVRWIMPAGSRAGSEMTLGVTGIRALQSRFKLDYPHVTNLKGLEFGTNYKKTFFKAFPETEGNVWVHHSIEQRVLEDYSGLFTEEEIHSLENLRGMPKSVNNKLHLSEIRLAWNQFYKQHRPGVATREQFLQKAAEIDSSQGSRFNPAVGGSR